MTAELKPSFFSEELLKHRFVIGAFAVSGLLVVGSVAYFIVASRAPSGDVAEIPSSASSGNVSAEGDVESVMNPTLSFETGGRVNAVKVAVGDKVYAGETLATLDLSTLSAGLAGAEAAQKSAEAKLDSLKSGPRDTDIAVRQAAVLQAKQSLAALYAAVPSSLANAEAKAQDAVRSAADPLFSNPNSASPSLVFSTSNAALSNASASARLSVGTELTAWSAELAALPASPSNADLDDALSRALIHLAVVRDFENGVVLALDSAIPTSAFPSSSIASSLAAVGAARDSLNGLVLSLTNSREGLKASALAVESAQTSLDQLVAGASSQDIEAAQAAVDAAAANVRSVQAQIGERVITAPFSGTVASVAVKTGEIAAPNTPSITLLPDAPLQAVVYVTEVDVGRIAVGSPASITLDAYGASRAFPATVAVIDQAPTTLQGGPVYKVTLSFTPSSPDVKAGMTANALITVKAK